MPSTQKFESGKHVKRPWSQSTASRDVESRSLEGAPVGRVRNHSEKGIGQARLNVSRKVVAVQRTKAGGAQKVSIRNWHGVLFDIGGREPEPLGNLRKPGRNIAEITPKTMISKIVSIPLLEHALS